MPSSSIRGALSLIQVTILSLLGRLLRGNAVSSGDAAGADMPGASAEHPPGSDRLAWRLVETDFGQRALDDMVGMSARLAVLSRLACSFTQPRQIGVT